MTPAALKEARAALGMTQRDLAARMRDIENNLIVGKGRTPHPGMG